LFKKSKMEILFSLTDYYCRYIPINYYVLNQYYLNRLKRWVVFFLKLKYIHNIIVFSQPFFN